MKSQGLPIDQRQRAPTGRVFAKFLAIYGALWLALLIGFADVSYPLLKKFGEAQMEERLRANAALLEEYVSSLGAYSTDDHPVLEHPVLEQVIRRLSQPNLLNAQVTLFSPKAEAIADSRLENPLIVRSAGRPEVRAALRKEIGSSIRYSQLERRLMAFVAYPHIHLGKVENVVRVGVPYASLDRSLWGVYLKIAATGLGLAIVSAALRTLFELYRRAA